MSHKTSIPLFWRLQKAKYRLVGTKCTNCSDMFFPPKSFCPKCRRKGKIAEHQFIGKGKIISFTVIRSAPEGFELQTPYAIGMIQLEEGPRIAGQIVSSPERIEIGKSVRTVFRKIYEDGEAGIIHYGMKWELEGL